MDMDMATVTVRTQRDLMQSVFYPPPGVVSLSVVSARRGGGSPRGLRSRGGQLPVTNFDPDLITSERVPPPSMRQVVLLCALATAAAFELRIARPAPATVDFRRPLSMQAPGEDLPAEELSDETLRRAASAASEPAAGTAGAHAEAPLVRAVLSSPVPIRSLSHSSLRDSANPPLQARRRRSPLTRASSPTSVCLRLYWGGSCSSRSHATRWATPLWAPLSWTCGSRDGQNDVLAMPTTERQLLHACRRAVWARTKPHQGATFGGPARPRSARRGVDQPVPRLTHVA